MTDQNTSIKPNIIDNQAVASTTAPVIAAAADDEDDFDLPGAACYYRPGDPEFEGCESCQ